MAVIYTTSLLNQISVCDGVCLWQGVSLSFQLCYIDTVILRESQKKNLFQVTGDMIA